MKAFWEFKFVPIVIFDVDNDDRKHCCQCGDRSNDMLATRDGNHAESAMLVFRHNTRIWDVCVLL